MNALQWLHQITPILSVITMVLAIGRFVTIKPHAVWSHGKNVGLIFIAGAALIGTFHPSSKLTYHGQLQLDMVQVGLFFYSWSWARAIQLCVREQQAAARSALERDVAVPKATEDGGSPKAVR